MKPTRRTQPYRRTLDRAPSQVLSQMQRGRVAGPTMGRAATPSRSRRPPFPRGLKGVRIPRA